MACLGIDLGTTNSCIARLYNGKSEVVVCEGERTTPSVVTITPNSFLVGKQAKVAQIDKGHMIHSTKRIIGRKIQEEAVQQEIEQITNEFSINEFKINESRTALEYDLTDIQAKCKPEQIFGFILEHLKSCYCKSTPVDQQTNKVVLTVPCIWNQSQRRATMNSAALANLDVIGLIPEPTAAAIYYANTRPQKDKPEEGKKERFLVFDLGGGTLDITVMEVDGNKYTTLETLGNPHLGGNDFDYKLLQYFGEKIYNETEKKFGRDKGIDLFEERENEKEQKYLARLKRQLKEDSERAKITLSNKPSARFDMVIQSYEGDNEVTVNLKITRNEFAAKIEEELDKIREVLEQVKSVKPEDIDRVIMIGGSSMIPAVRDLVEEIYGDKFAEVDPFESVALGAAIYGGMKLGEVPVIINDVTPMNIFQLTRKQDKTAALKKLIDRNMTKPQQSEWDLADLKALSGHELCFSIYESALSNPIISQDKDKDQVYFITKFTCKLGEDIIPTSGVVWSRIRVDGEQIMIDFTSKQPRSMIEEIPQGQLPESIVEQSRDLTAERTYSDQTIQMYQEEMARLKNREQANKYH